MRVRGLLYLCAWDSAPGGAAGRVVAGAGAGPARHRRLRIVLGSIRALHLVAKMTHFSTSILPPRPGFAGPRRPVVAGSLGGARLLALREHWPRGPFWCHVYMVGVNEFIIHGWNLVCLA